MFFPGIWAQEIPQRILHNALINHRLANSLLFVGPRGVGKESMAFAVAKALLCPVENKNGTYCGRCNECRRIDAVESLDVRYFFPMRNISTVMSENQKRKISEEARGKIEEKKSKKAFLPEYRDTEAIHSIYTFREELLKFLSMSSFSSRVKVAILRDIDRMKPETANLFLKTLEEPPPGSYIICTVDSKAFNSILPTIRSRCQVVRFRRWTQNEIIRYLSEELAVEDEEKIKLAANMCDGSIVRAREILDNLNRTDMEAAYELLDSLDMEELIEKIEKLKIGRNISAARNIITSAAYFLRDQLASKYGGEQYFSTKEFPRGLAKLTEDNLILKRIEKMSEAVNFLGYNAYIPLVLTVAFLPDDESEI